MESQLVATLQRVCRENFQASFKQLSTRLNIYNLIASAALDIQERIIAQVDILKGDGQELYKRKRKPDNDEEKGEKERKRKKHMDSVIEIAETPGIEMDIDSDQTNQYVFSRMNKTKIANLHQKCSGWAPFKLVHEGSRNRHYEQVHKGIHEDDEQRCT